MLSPLAIALIVAFVILSLGIHEAAHAWVASLRGDDTAKREGRLTLNPVPHIDPVMTILVPALLAWSTAGKFIFGGARPVPVNYYNLKRPMTDMALVAIAGPLSNFLLAIVFLAIEKYLEWEVGMDPRALAPTVMGRVALTNIILAIFNLIPIPPLDGSRVMAWLLPSSLRETYVGLERFGMLIIVALLLTGTLQAVLYTAIRPAFQAVDFLSGGTW